jgi:hypothetical protein
MPDWHIKAHRLGLNGERTQEEKIWRKKLQRQWTGHHGGVGKVPVQINTLC